MKRIPKDKQIHIAARGKRKWLKRIRRRNALKTRSKVNWKKHSFRQTNYIEAPRVFSLTQNYDETVACLTKLKDSVVAAKKSSGLLPNTFIDLAKIEILQPAAALVLAAELDRWRKALGVTLKPRNLANWNRSVLEFLCELGLFDLLEIDQRFLRKVLANNKNGTSSRVALKFVSDCRNDKEPTDALAEQLANKVPEFKDQLSEENDMVICTALAEASLNCVDHGYKYFDTYYPIADHRWWAAASYQDDGKTVKFFVYDQGVGIPKTLPKTSIGREILKVFGIGSDGVSALKSDSEAIRFVLENRITSTKKDNRGKGFPQIVAAVSGLGGALRVISGKGSAIYTRENGAEALGDNARHLGGTLLEWTFKLDRT